MQKVEVNLNNCFWIESLSHVFNFDDSKKVNLIYAKNWTMKSSFANVLKKYQEWKQWEIKDRIFNYESSHEIKIDDLLLEKNQSHDKIFVFWNIDENYQSNNISNLLLKPELKEKFDEVLELKFNLLEILKTSIGLGIPQNKEDLSLSKLEKKFLLDFSLEDKSFLDAIEELDLGNINEIEVVYKDVFDNSKLEELILSQEFQDNIDWFMTKSEEIYQNTQYSYLEKGKFSFWKLKEVQVILDKNNFFVKNNKVMLDWVEKTKTELAEEVRNLKQELIETPEYEKISDKLNNTDKWKKLLNIIENDISIISELKNYKCFRKKLWHQYLDKARRWNDRIIDLLKEKYSDLKSNITDENMEKSKWEKAVTIFNDRFSVPFEMEISNLKNALFWEIPVVNFKFEREGWLDPVIKSQDEIVTTLSQWEKRALYLLNVIFDIEAFKQKINENPDKKYLFIIDDIADSFDYKNKYAIVEYLKEIIEYDNFYSIILTHNFDFFRFVKKRLNCSKSSFHSIKQWRWIITFDNNTTDEPRKKRKQNLNEKNIIALIPFVRNLIEYGSSCQKDFLLLTHVLHQKQETKYDNEWNIKAEYQCDENECFTIPATEEIFFSHLEEIYKKCLWDNMSFSDDLLEKKPIEFIMQIDEDSAWEELEDKLLISIGIRLLAEEFLKKQLPLLDSQINVNGFSKDQFGNLYKKYNNICKTRFQNVNENSARNERKNKLLYEKWNNILNKVSIMTPENIHINSFMYEPILDMDILELKNLYEKTVNLDDFLINWQD